MEHGGRIVIIVDHALAEREAEGRPIRVGMVGAGFMGQGLRTRSSTRSRACGWWRSPTGDLERARDVFRYAGIDDIADVDTQAALEDAIRGGRAGGHRRCDAAGPLRQVDVLVDVTGSVEFGARVVLEAFAHGKHIVLMNAEIDATIGPILQVEAPARRA